MPHPGRIKKIKVRLVGGADFWFDKEKSQPIFASLGGYISGNIFSIMLFKKDEVENPNPNPEGSIFEDGEIIPESILSTYECFMLTGVISFEDLNTHRRRCNFTYSLKDYSLSEGDYINIRSEKTIPLQKTKEKYSVLLPF